MAGELLAMRRAAVGAPVSEYERLVDRARVNGGGVVAGETMSGVNTATSLVGTTATAHATPHTKGDWVELVASSAAATEMVELIVGGVSSSGVNTSMLLDIGTGAAASEAVKIPNLMVGYLLGGSTENLVNSFNFPISIPAGTRIAARIQGAVTVDTCDVAVRLHRAGSHSAAGTTVTAIGADTATSTGAVLTTAGAINTKSDWTQITATTAGDYKWLIVALSNNSVTGVSAAGFVDIGVGAAASETVLIPDIPYGVGSTEYLRYPTSSLHTVNLAAGVRLSARYQATSTAAGGKVNVAVYGIR